MPVCTVHERQQVVRGSDDVQQQHNVIAGSKIWEGAVTFSSKAMSLQAARYGREQCHSAARECHCRQQDVEGAVAFNSNTVWEGAVT